MLRVTSSMFACALERVRISHRQVQKVTIPGAACMVVLFSLAAAIPSPAQVLTMLAGVNRANDGADFSISPLRGSSGNFYGTTSAFRLPTSSIGVMTSPVPGSQFTGSTVTFTWTPGTQSTAYWLDLGSTQGGNNYYQSGNLGDVLTTTVSGLPTDGSPVYATLWSLENGQWVYNEYTYTAYNQGSALGVITSPAPGSTLTGSSVLFSWTAGSQASAYWIDAGSTQGGNQYFQSGNIGNVTSYTVTGLHTNGSTVYITLWSLVSGQWLNNQYTYTASSQSGSQGVLTTPAPGSMLPGSTVTFGWTAGAGAAGYWLDLGNVPGGNQYFQSGNLGNVLQVTANGLPTNGSTVYATLYTLVNGQWLPNAYTYTAFSQQSSLGVMQTPAPGSTLYGNTQTFTWSAGSGASAYWLDIGSAPGGNNYYQSGNLGNVLSTTVQTLPANNTEIFVTLWSLVNGQWLNNQYTYTSAAQGTDTVVMSLLVDRSGSEAVSGGGVALQAAVPQFVQYFTQGTDYVSLVSYASHSSIDVPATVQFLAPVDTAIAGLSFTGGNFGTGAGTGTVYSESNGPPLTMADFQNNSVSLPPGSSDVKVVVYFTDEVMNTLQDQFDCPGTTLMNYGGENADAPGEGPPYPPEVVFSLNPTSETFAYCYDTPSDPDGTFGCNTSYLPEYLSATACTYNGVRAVFPSQQYGRTESLTRYNVSNESQWRALYTANQIRSETLPTYVFVIGLGNALAANPCSEAFLATLANDPSAGSYSGGANCATGNGVYNSNLPAGLFVLVPDCPSSQCTAALEEVFLTIASKLR